MTEEEDKLKSVWIPAFIGGGLSSLLIVGLLFSGFAPNLNLGPSPQAKPLPPSATPSHTISAAKEVSPAVVGIANLGPVEDEFLGSQVVERGSGSGVIIDPSGMIVTNNHVVEGATDLVVSLADGRQTRATVIGRDPAMDLAVIKVRSPGLVAARLGDSGKLQVGETAIAIGNPLGKEFARSVTVGVISATNRPVNVGERILTLLQTDAAINPGNSGGALVNFEGSLVGINSAKLSAPGVEGIGFAIPINDARPVINELISSGRVSRAWMGVKATSVDGPLNQKFGLPSGVLVGKVVPGSPAQKAGLMRGDIILAIDGKRITGLRDLGSRLDGCYKGDVTRIQVYRDKKEMEFEVELGEEGDSTH